MWSPSANWTMAFLNAGRRPILLLWDSRPINARFNLPLYRIVRTSLTFTSQMPSTAFFISILLDFRSTMNV